MKLSRKEIISILLSIAAVSYTWPPQPFLTLLNPQILSILNATVFVNILPLHVSVEQLFQQVVCVGTAFSCLLHAASIYFYHSNYARTRQHMRFVLVTILLILAIVNCVSITFYTEYTKYKKLSGSTIVSTLFTTFELGSTPACMALTVAIIVLLVAVVVIVILTIIRKTRRNRKK